MIVLKKNIELEGLLIKQDSSVPGSVHTIQTWILPENPEHALWTRSLLCLMSHRTFLPAKTLWRIQENSIQSVLIKHFTNSSNTNSLKQVKIQLYNTQKNFLIPHTQQKWHMNKTQNRNRNLAWCWCKGNNILGQCPRQRPTQSWSQRTSPCDTSGSSRAARPGMSTASFHENGWPMCVELKWLELLFNWDSLFFILHGGCWDASF